MSGQVWSKRRTTTKGGWRKLRKNVAGYLVVTLYDGERWAPQQVHRLVLETYIGPCPKGLECRHLDGDPANNCLDNLRWGTPKENGQDKIEHGTRLRGEQNKQSKLTEDEVHLIFNAYHDGAYNQYELAKMFGVHQTLISLICQKKAWGYLWND